MGADSFGRVLLLTDSQRLAQSVGAELRHAHFEVQDISREGDLTPSRLSFRPDLVTIDLETAGISDEKLAAWMKDAHGAWGTQVLLLLRGTGEHRLRALFRNGPTHFLAIERDDHLNARDLLATVQKILSPREIFGLERYLETGADQKIIRLRHSQEKNDVVEKVASYAQGIGFNTRIAQGLAVVADELVTNCLYNAPTDSSGHHRFSSLARTVPVMLEENEVAELRMSFDGRRFGISAMDPFGSLTPVKVLDYLAKCFRKENDQIDSKEGGAGLGLYKLFTLLQHFVVNIQPGVRTEIIGLIDITRSYKEFAVRGKSFNLFVASQARSPERS